MKSFDKIDLILFHLLHIFSTMLIVNLVRLNFEFPTPFNTRLIEKGCISFLNDFHFAPFPSFI